MRNRAIQVKMVKTDKDESTTQRQVEEEFEVKAAIVSIHLRNALETAGKMALAYVIVDTFRQVAIEHAKK